MHRPAFNQPADLWLPDGSLRDVHVADVTAADWKTLLALAREGKYQYTQDGKVQDMPESSDVLADQEHTHLLRIEIDGVKIHCHFFNPGNIEMDIDPRDVNSPRRHLAVLTFLETLGNRTHKSILVSDEGNRDSAYLRYEPLQVMWHVYEPPNSDA